MSASEPLIAIDDGLRSHLESGVAIVVGTRDASLSPEITRGWGARIMPDCHTIELCVSRSTGAKTLANLRDNEELAVTFALPTSYKTVQLKGRFLESGEPTPEDLEGVERHRNAFAKQAEIVGLPRSLSSRLWTDGVVKIRFVVRQAFEQTPGPGAGGPL